MLLATPLADGSTRLEEDVYFTCGTGTTGVYRCIGVGDDVIAVFKALQQQINRFASRVHFAPVTVDGEIGPGTLAAAQAVATYLQGHPEVISIDAPDTVNALSASATDYTSTFSQAGYDLGIPSYDEMMAASGGTPSAPVVTIPAAPPATSSAPTPEPTKAPGQSSNTWLWVGGAVLLAAAAGTVGYVVYKRRQKKQLRA